MVGHRWAVELLSGAIAAGRVSHAYLFTGPQSIGKTTLARAFAQTLLCERENRPCGECLACRKVLHDTHPDLRIVEPGYGSDVTKSGREEPKSLGIDAVRTVTTDAALSPFEGSCKVFLIPGAEAMTVEAQNALLKTLEEPPPAVVLLLCALRAESLLPTIVSRCQVFNLRSLPAQMVSEALQKRWGVAKERADLLAALSGGRVGWAVTAGQEEKILKDREEIIEELASVPRRDRLERMKIAERWARQPEETQERLEMWLGWWRDLLLVHNGFDASGGIRNLDRRKTLEEEARRYSVAQIAGVIDALERTVAQVERNANLRLALEVLMLDLPSGG